MHCRAACKADASFWKAEGRQAKRASGADGVGEVERRDICCTLSLTLEENNCIPQHCARAAQRAQLGCAGCERHEHEWEQGARTSTSGKRACLAAGLVAVRGVSRRVYKHESAAIDWGASIDTSNGRLKSRKAGFCVSDAANKKLKIHIFEPCISIC